MTDINKFEELAKEMDAEMFKSLRWDELTIKLFGQLPSLISKYRRMEEALRTVNDALINEEHYRNDILFDVVNVALMHAEALQDEDE